VVELALFGGLVIGALVSWLLAQRSQQGELTQLRVENATLQTQADAAREDLAKADLRHHADLENMKQLFESTATQVLRQTVSDFSEDQDKAQKLRNETLKETLSPLEQQLNDYRKMLEGYNLAHVEALSDVKAKAAILLEAQQETQASTSRLNQLLGRSDQRGHWGEIQMANILEKSGLREGIDYVLQSTRTDETGQRKRPDCVVHLPNGTKIVIDAKFPFDAFERSLDETDPVVRRGLLAEHASALKDHVRTLKRKGYWVDLPYTPAFTVCFVPSDAALAAAFESDADLHRYAVGENVLIVGPTNLLAMLWSAGLVLQQYQQAVNAETILAKAGQLYDRIATLGSHLQKLGKSLAQSVDNYNNVIGSAETNMLVTARTLHELAATRNTTPPEGLNEVESTVRSLEESKWGADLSDPELAARAELIELEVIDEVE
jgi:DNA recombination protein RmuC